jgi:hypothetical protein
LLFEFFPSVFLAGRTNYNIYTIIEFVQLKMSPNNREFLIWKERVREGLREREGGG